ncbi:hypothetical protein [Alteromonas facilis]|uniref:hypothetical protein n=1 Tax=Alteromonas facilis TaxID=2048004 RepID=UPI000C28325F|nr:hypothetical protein [Alteromonas facilis]
MNRKARNKQVDSMLNKHPQLTHSEQCKVVSHVQRMEDDWYINTLMLEGYEIPFIYKRKQPYQSLKGARVNLTYYPHSQIIAGIEFETMKVVRLKRS